MAKGMSMKVLLQLQTKEFRKGIDNIKRQLNGFKNFMKSAFALGSITMFGKQMVQVSKDFEDAMARVKAVSNATTEEFKMMSDEAERLGRTTRYTATEAASALENLTRNGMSATNATKALSGVLAMAQANSIGLADAANIMTNTLNMFSLGVQNATRVSDVMSSTASHAATDITSLYEAMANAAPAANVLGLSLEETAAAIGALAQKGVKGSEAGTKLRIALQKMADPKVIGKMKGYGIDIDEATIRAEGLYKTIEKLREANLSLGQLGTIFDAKSAMALQLLISGLDDIDMMLGVVSNSAGETSRMMAQSVGSVQKELDTLKSKYEGLLISIGQKTSGVVKGAIKLLQNLIGNFDTMFGTIMNIASVAVPLLMNRVIELTKNLKTMFTQAAAGAATAKAAMGGWVTLIATLVTWVGTALVGAWNEAHRAMREAESQLAETTTKTANAKKEVKKLKEAIGDGTNKAGLAYAIKRACELFPDFTEYLKEAARIAGKTDDWERLKQILEEIADLEAKLSSAEVGDKIAKANGEYIGTKLYDSTRYYPFKYGAFAKGEEPYENVAKDIRKQIEKIYPNGKDASKEVLKEVGVMVSTSKDIDTKVKEVQQLLGYHGVEVTDDAVKTLINGVQNSSKTSKYYSTAVEYSGKSQREQQEAMQGSYDMLKDNFNKAKAQEEKLLHERKITTKEFNENMKRAADTFHDEAINIKGITKEMLQEVTNLTSKYRTTKETPEPSGGDSSTKKGDKTDAEKINDVIDNYIDEFGKLQNRLKAGTISQEDYNAELKKLVDKTWETITAFDNFRELLAGTDLSTIENAYNANRDADAKADYEKAKTEKQQKTLDQIENLLKNYKIPKEGKRDTRFDYSKTGNDIFSEEVNIKVQHADALNELVKSLREGIINGEFDQSMGAAVKVLMELKLAAMAASKEAETLQHKLNYSEMITKLDDEIASLKERSIDSIGTLSNVFDNLYRSIQSIAEAFGEDLEWEGFEKMMAVVNASVQIFETLRGVIEALNIISQLSAKQKQKDAVKSAMANKLEAKSEIEKASAEGAAAAAGAGSALSSIPVVGPALAVAAIAAVVAAIALGVSKLSGFANGGYVKGGSKSGDHTLIRANEGELVLNAAQQRNLLNIANGKTTAGGGQVTFKLRGADLIGAIENEQSRRRG